MVEPTTGRERALRQRGYRRIAGADEAGRGAWAGPLVAAAVILPVRFPGAGTRDSKLLSPAARERAYDIITRRALAWAVRIEPAAAIDRAGIQAVNLRALVAAVTALNPSADYALIDGWRLTLPLPSERIIHGDALVLSIAAASILAKVTRDRLMVSAHRRYPRYGFNRHKGYGTRQHRDALARRGPCPLHRRSFRPIADTYVHQNPHR